MDSANEEELGGGSRAVVRGAFPQLYHGTHRASPLLFIYPLLREGI